MNHIEEVTEGLMETFRGLRAGTVENKDAQEMANVGGKIISAYKVRLAYAYMRGSTEPIPGLEVTPSLKAIRQDAA